MSQRYIGGVVTETTNVAQSPWTGEWTQQAALQGFAGAQAPLKVANSLRFRSSASAYLSRTPSVAGNRQTWTWSGWVKRGSLQTSPRQTIFSASDGTLQNYTEISFDIDLIRLLNYTANVKDLDRTSTSVYRDPSAWYHIVLAFDTTQAVATNRQRVYVNGVEVTAWTNNAQMAQNANGWVSSTQPHRIALLNGFTSYFDGYLANINFIDGQALPPTAFGTFSKENGVWSPITYTGTYGTNGFRLNFSNGTSTTTLGYDSSGNGNNWTTNNISLTAGSTYDWMIDSPTKYPGSSYGVGNYAVLNPLQVTAANIGTISNGNLSWSCGASATYGKIYGSISIPTTGKFYWEVTANGTANLDIGIIAASDQTTYYPGYSAKGYVYYQSTGQKVNNNTYSTYGASYTTNDVIGIAFDADAGTLSFYKNNVSQGVAFTGLTGTVYTATLGNEASSGSAAAAINFGQRPFAYTPPSGYKSLCTQNLPGVTIQNGAAYMAATTYTGSGASMTISNAVNGVGFQPDFVWGKLRTTSSYHRLSDSVRGASLTLATNVTDVEVSGNGLVSFDASGFSMNSSTNINQVYPYVAWQWKAGGTAVTNTAGTITSSVSANTTSGFSVVTYTGNGATSTQTIGHGLGTTLSMVIIKARGTGSNDNGWAVSHTSIAAPNYLYLNSTGQADNYGPGQGQPSIGTGNTFKVLVGTTGTNNLNASGINYVAYCFAAIPGYSAFGSYTGNGSADGPFVYCGFRPRFVLVKRTDAATYPWVIFDTARSTYNVITSELYPNDPAAEANSSNDFDIVSNGFKCRIAAAAYNASGGTYIYAAFAENPFQNALAR